MTVAVVGDGLVLRTLARIGRIAIFFAEMVVQCGRVDASLKGLGCRTDRRFAWNPGNPENRRSNGPFEITYLLTFGL